MYKTPYGVFNGNSWEDFCQQCFKRKYEDQGYQEMPATFNGDLGIEGYTRTGLFFQCYCPDAEYDPSKLYNAQRTKITKDLGKLITYQKELASYLSNIKVEKWIFVIPEYKNKELVKHCHSKAEEYRNYNLPFLSPTFDVLVHDIEFFTAEIPIILNFRNDKLAIDSKTSKSDDEIADWKSQSISLVDNAIRKHGQRVPKSASNYDDKVNKITENTVANFLNGDTLIRKWQETYPEQYEKFISVIDLFEKRVEEKCAVFSGNSNELYKEIESELKQKITDSFSFLDQVMIDKLTNRVLADWVLRCPISFE